MIRAILAAGLVYVVLLFATGAVHAPRGHFVHIYQGTSDGAPVYRGVRWVPERGR